MTSPREQLADLLKQARLAAGHRSHSALARKLNVSRSLVTKAESATQPVPTDETLEAWADATHADVAEFKKLAERSKSGSPEWFMPYERAEAEATVVRGWSPMLMLGLLQTERYMRDVLSKGSYSPERLEELVRARMERKAVIGRARLIAIIDHLVLQRMIGSPAVMAEQCRHLIAMAERHDVALHVISEYTNMGLYGAFDLATARDGTTTVRLETMRDITSTEPDMVEEAMLAFDELLGVAMPRAESLTFARDMEETWKARM